MIENIPADNRGEANVGAMIDHGPWGFYQKCIVGLLAVQQPVLAPAAGLFQKHLRLGQAQLGEGQLASLLALQ